MKVILKILCFLLALYCIYFPLTYFNGPIDKKQVKSSHILVATKEEAQNIKNKLEKESFYNLAKKYSNCISAEDGGDLGFKERGRLLPEFEKVVFNQPKNVVSEPFETKEGWHIVKVTDINYFSDKENFSRRYFITEKEALRMLNK